MKTTRKFGIVLAAVAAVCCGLIVAGHLHGAEPIAPLAQIKDKKKDKVVPKDVLPGTLSIISAQPGSKNSSVELHQVKYTGATAFGRPVTGSADVALTLVGHALPVLKNQKFAAIVHDKQGKTSAALITLGEDLAATHFLGSKLDLILEKGGQIVQSPAPKTGVAPYHFKGTVRLRMPYVTENGKPVEVHLGKGPGRKPIEIPLSTNTFALADKDVAFAPTTLLMDGFKFVNVQAFKTFRVQFHPEQKTKPFDAETSLGQTEVIAYLPRFLLTQGFKAHAKEIKIEQGGTEKTVPDTYLSSFSAVTLEPPKLQFIRPMGYDIDCKGISLKVIKGEYTDATVEGRLWLPDKFAEYKGEPKSDPSQKVPQPAKEASEIQTPPYTRAKIDNVKLTYHTGKVRPYWSAAGSDPFSVTWNEGRFGLIVEDKQYSLLLDGPGAIQVTAGKFFARAFVGSDGSTPVQIPMKTGDQFFLQSIGASGQVTINPKDLNKDLTYPGTKYKIIITSPATTWHFSQGHLVAVQNYTGTIDVPTKADLSVKMTVNVDGDPSASLAGGHLSLPAYGIYFAIAQGVLKPPEHYAPPKQGQAPSDEYKKWLFHLSGTITFDTPTVPQLKGVVVPVADVIFNADGLFGDPNEKTPKTRISMGEVDVDLKSFVFKVQNFDLPSSQQRDAKTQQKDPHLSVNGQAWLSNDLPIIAYDPGLRIAPTKSTALLDANQSGEFVSTAAADGPGVPDFGTLHVQKNLGFASIDFTLSKDKRLFGGQTVDCLFGSGTLKLSDAGKGADGVSMFVANGSWLVFGSVDLPVLIPLGDSGLELYGFRGGLGNNINVKPDVITSGKKGGDLKPDDFLAAPGNFLFQAGVGITTADQYLAWGDALVTVTTAPFSLNIGVFANLAESRGPSPSHDRTATGMITVTGSSFTAQLAVDINFPNRSTTLAAISGTATLYVDKSSQYLHIGWPFPDNAGRISIIGGFLHLDGGLAIDISEGGPNAGASLAAAFGYRENFLGIVQGEMDGWLKVGLKQSGVDLAGGVHILGEVDFYVFSAYAEAWLNGGLTTSPFEMSVAGGIDGCIDTPIGKACAGISFSATFP